MSNLFINLDLKEAQKFSTYLDSLGELVNQSADAYNYQIREKFLNEQREYFFNEVISVIHQLNSEFLEHNNENIGPTVEKWDLESLLLKLRVFRGLLIFLRNLLAFGEDFMIHDLPVFYDHLFVCHIRLLQSFTIISKHKIMVRNYHISQAQNIQIFIVEKLSVAVFQCLNNISRDFNKFKKDQTQSSQNVTNKIADLQFNKILRLISEMTFAAPQFSGDIMNNIDTTNDNQTLLSCNNREYFNSFLVYLNQFIINGDAIIYQHNASLSSNFILHLLKNYDDAVLLKKLCSWFLSIYESLYMNHNQATDSAYSNSNFLILSNIFSNIFKHESFTTFISRNIESKKNFDLITDLSHISQILLTNINRYSKDDLMVVLTWLSDFMSILVNIIDEFFANTTNQNLKDSQTAKFLNLNLFYLLDTLSHLITFNSVVELLNYYKFLNVLIQLLKVLQKNIQPISKLLDSKSISEGSMLFKNLKKLTIENMSYLISNNFENQELVRTSHCLEIILSNCIIDALNPYIKETCIICIKYLMQDNPENQNFVRSLEAKKIINEDELNERGVEIEIVEGKVQFKKKKIREID